MLGRMREPRPRARHAIAPCRERGEKGIVRDLAEHDDDSEIREQVELASEERAAARELRRRRPIARRCAPGGGRDVDIRQSKAIVARDRRGLVREAGGVERAVEPIAALVAREDASRPIAPVRRRREADHEKAGGRIAEPGNGSPPVRPIAEARDPFARDAFAVGHQTRTGPAPAHPRGEPRERVTRRRGRRR